MDTKDAGKQESSTPDKSSSSDFRPQKSHEIMPPIAQGMSPQQVVFPNKNTAQVIAPPPNTDAADIVRALGIGKPSAVFLITGSVEGVDDEVRSHLTQLFSRGIARAAADLQALIIDGGRNSGLMSMIGQSVADRGRKSVLMGIAPARKIIHPNGSGPDGDDTEPMDVNHSHFVLTDGDEWGDETETIFKLAAELAQDCPIMTILVNGDDQAKGQVLQSVRHNWPIIVIKDSGSLANEITILRQQRPDFIPDPVLAEIIFDGKIHPFPLTVSVKDFEEQLKQLASPNPEADDTTLELAWRRFAMYDANANRQQRVFSNLQKYILFLGVLATTLAVIQNQVEVLDLPALNAISGSLYYIILILPITISFLIAVGNRFNAGSKWILSRASAESIKKEIYRYRAHAEIYSDRETKQLSRDIKLTRRIDTISSKLMQTEVNTSAMPQYDGPIPPKYGAADGDNGLDFLTPDRFMTYRLKDQLTWYRSKTVKLEEQLRRLQWLIYLIGAAGTLLAAVGLELWIAVTTALVTAFGTYLEYQKTEEKLMRYNQTATDLANVESWWVALSPEEQANPDFIDKLVGQTETSIYSEHAAWVQDMQDAMAELRAEQTGEESPQQQGGGASSPPQDIVESSPAQDEADSQPESDDSSQAQGEAESEPQDEADAAPNGDEELPQQDDREKNKTEPVAAASE